MALLDLSISFPNLGIEFYDLPNSFTIFGFKIAFYGLIIGLGMLAGMIIGFREARISGQNLDDYIDLALYGIIFAIVGARLYYVIFQWDHYKDDLMDIFNLREGGLAIYGGIIAAIIVCIIVAKVKKKSFWQMADTGCIGLILGQIIGRWGNFFNREAFGGDTDSLFAMKINTWDLNVGGVSVPEGVSYIDEAGQFIQVQPTFLYESFLNLCVLLIIMAFRKNKKYHGEVFLWYMCGYGVVRAFVEGMRTDQLIIGNTGIPVSQALAIVFAVVCGGAIIYNRIKKRGCKSVWKVEETYDDGFVDETVETA
ncbi:MAG: prolipoprotein diacylglyceryl transferase [Lachnospiraceae bacterium]|nr:prolipoprotein diacylglyceryl transferase [Lachnospiraceae bacterium]